MPAPHTPSGVPAVPAGPRPRWQGDSAGRKDREGSGRAGRVARLAQAGRPARCAGATRAGLRNAQAPAALGAHMLCGLGAHMLATHTSTCACVYIYTDIHERDYYRYRFTYTVNTSNYCGILKTAESAPDIRPCLSLSLPSQPVPLLRLANAMCQSPSWAACWGEAGLPISHSCTLSQEGAKHLP